MNLRRPNLRAAVPHPPGKRSAGVFFACAGLLGLAAGAVAPCARADAAGYLVNVTVRPGYNFANADQALSYGYGICDKVSQGRTYAQIMGDAKADFTTSDEYQVSYIIAQAVDELCPALLWQLRNSAAHYVPPPPAIGG
ncbi:hypothetical protein A9W98_19535 [Mycobacterium gordonae]|jgi:hypothetical protein|uniref:DUF732 domain-containing protein n=1 Tax=Mycobacterium gordonae TaxID=1778 RepID=A0A1A6BH12_MYCGO|nr:DUF732 domain-containing protein [Mycobacterium gordonae]MBI2703565.1 DUF732 domain-containing protein [Mycobacterium sp.]OBS01581.1 hypothetical protein A9W98_19535 [Mycobacterium gordonae]